MNKAGLDYINTVYKKLSSIKNHKDFINSITESHIHERMLRLGYEAKVYELELGNTNNNYTNDMYEMAKATLIDDNM